MSHARTSVRTPRAPLTGLLSVLLATALLTLAPSPAEADVVDWGRTKAADQRFRHDCHPYRYRYDIDPPSEDWVLETFLRGPGGKRLAADQFLPGSDPTSGRATFKVCGVTTRPGRFTIRAKVTYEKNLEERVSRLEPSYFRLTRG